MAAHYTKACQQIVEDYRRAGGSWPARKAELAEWALNNKRWSPSREDIRRMCGEALTEAMRLETFVDESGREVRAKLSANTTRDGEQGAFWADLRTAPIDFVRVGVTQLRNGIVADCHRMSNAVRYSNDHRGSAEQITLSLDFTKDIRELDQPKPVKRPELSPSSSERRLRSGKPQHAIQPSTSGLAPSPTTLPTSAHV